MEHQYHALIDDRLVEDTLFLRRGVGTPRLLSPDPVVPKGELLGTVHRDAAGRWTMWYTQFIPRDPATDLTGCESPMMIARSTDGIHWEKPDLGLVTGPRYAGHPNVIIGWKQTDANGRYISGWGALSGMSIIDHEATPHPCARARYTGLSNVFPIDTIGGLMLLTSDDGIAWTAYPENPVIISSSDTLNTLLWDQALGKYVVYMRPNIHCGMAAHANRKMARSESADLIHWTPPRVILDTDERDADAFDVFDEPGMRGPRGRSKQFQGMTPFILNGVYIGFTWFYDARRGFFANELVHSADGVHWQREALRDWFVADGIPAGFRGKILVPGCDAPILQGDEYYFYTSANPYGHHEIAVAAESGDDARRVELLESQDIYGFAIKRDRWIGYQAGETEGEFLSTPIDWEGGSPLWLNAAIKAGGSIRLEIEDQWGRPVKDAHLDEIHLLEGPRDETDIPVGFGPGKSIMKFPPIGPIRLRMFLQHATLYGWSYAQY